MRRIKIDRPVTTGCVVNGAAGAGLVFDLANALAYRYPSCWLGLFLLASSRDHKDVLLFTISVCVQADVQGAVCGQSRMRPSFFPWSHNLGSIAGISGVRYRRQRSSGSTHSAAGCIVCCVCHSAALVLLFPLPFSFPDKQKDLLGSQYVPIPDHRVR